MGQVIFPVFLVSSIGLVAGFILAVASVVMHVPKDEIAEKIKDILPGANCGACGYSGCEGYAKALSGGKANIGLCSPGGKTVAEGISKILGANVSNIEYKVAVVKCSGMSSNTDTKMIYQGVKSCSAANQLYSGPGNCSYGCIGFGDCLKVCKYGAITICDGVAVINPQKCVGCSMCVSACPKGLIEFIPIKKQAIVKCSNCDKGAKTKKDCSAGCIGCMKCAKVCESNAIIVENFVAKVNPEKCIGCGKCLDVCKQNCIEIFS